MKFFIIELKQSSEHLRDVRENYQNYFAPPSAKCIKLSAFQNITTLVAILKYMKALEDNVPFNSVSNRISQFFARVLSDQTQQLLFQLAVLLFTCCYDLNTTTVMLCNHQNSFGD